MRIHLASLLLLSLVFINCRRDSRTEDPFIANPHPIQARLNGTVLDENGQALPGATIRVGQKMAVSDSRGHFTIQDAPLDKYTSLARVEMAGYFHAYRSFAATSGANHITVQLLKKQLAGTVSSSAGGDILLSNGTLVELPANGFVNAQDNSDYSGDVRVYMSYIDPASQQISQQVPGSLMGDNPDGSRVALAAFSMMAVELESPSGQSLQLKSGLLAHLKMPVPSSLQGSAPATLPLWSLDEQKGIWKQEGSATLSGDHYTTSVEHFSFWGCLAGWPSVQLSVTLQNASADPLVHVKVRVRKPGPYGASAYAWTDSLGQASGTVFANDPLILEVLDPCFNVIHAQNISPLTQNTDLGVITIPSSANSVVTISGQLVDCNSNGIANGYAVIWYSNQVLYAATNAQGNFSATFATCTNAGSSAMVYGFNQAGQQLGATTTVSITGTATNAGMVTVCSSSSNQFINYSLDGVSYTINDQTPGDSLVSAAVPTGNVVMMHFVGTHHTSPSDIIAFSFEIPAGPFTGSFPLTQLYVREYSTASVVFFQPLPVHLTHFAQFAGDYHEGNFTGQFKDLNQLVHNVSCSFRVKRNQ